jgi:hypothetical protein
MRELDQVEEALLARPSLLDEEGQRLITRRGELLASGSTEQNRARGEVIRRRLLAEREALRDQAQELAKAQRLALLQLFRAAPGVDEVG